MSTVDAPNVHVIGVDGTSDDLDVPIRNVFEDTAFCAVCWRVCRGVGGGCVGGGFPGWSWPLGSWMWPSWSTEV
jgi:hypothetical protein